MNHGCMYVSRIMHHDSLWLLNNHRISDPKPISCPYMDALMCPASYPVPTKIKVSPSYMAAHLHI